MLQGWSGSVIPSSAGYAFAPVSRDYSAVAANQTAQDYAAVPAYTLTGTVAVGTTPTAGVAFAANNGGICTASNASGQYSCTVPQGWTGSVTPSLSGYGFTPASRAYSSLAGNQAAQDFAAANVGATTVFYVHPDHLNTPRMIADANQNTVWRWDQGEPFGNDVPNGDPNNTGSVFKFNLRFPGQYFDRETNLAYNYFRDYDPAIGGYKQSDPIGLKAGLNTYAYVNGKPLIRIDPFGLAGGDIFGSGGSRGGYSPVPGPFDVFIPGTPANNAFVNSINQIKELCFPDDRCKKVLKTCREECLDKFVNDPNSLPGTGSDLAGRQRRCIRECMERNDCFDF
ncbi:MAG TPA: RHS repeat-associated core domain-containing protein [Burkholderiales bacterium]|nr:RHS repeat-associated core domain-containing protein [Burkholderiales bacterium]